MQKIKIILALAFIKCNKYFKYKNNFTTLYSEILL